MITQIELVDRKKLLTIVELSSEMAEYIDTFHNEKRRHSSVDMQTQTNTRTFSPACFKRTERDQIIGVRLPGPKKPGRAITGLDQTPCQRPLAKARPRKQNSSRSEIGFVPEVTLLTANNSRIAAYSILDAKDFFGLFGPRPELAVSVSSRLSPAEKADLLHVY